MKRLLASLLMFVLLLGSALAAVEVDHTNVATSVQIGQVALYDVEIKNTADSDVLLYASLDDIRFSMTLDPITDFTSGIRVPANSVKETQLKVVPNENLRIGEYNIRLDLTTSDFKKVYSDVLTIYVAPDENIFLQPDVTVRLAIDPRIDPREEIKVIVSASNNNNLDLGDVFLDVKSGLFHREVAMSLGPQGSDSVSFNVQLDPLSPPRDDFVVATVFAEDNSILGADRMDVQIIEYSPPLDKRYQQHGRFLKTSTDVIITNNGNVRQEESIRMEMPWYRGFLSRSVPVHETERDNGRRYWAFPVTLGPTETTTLTVTTSYRVPFVFLLLVLLGVAAYWVMRSPIVIEKHARIVQRNEGGISKLKIYLRIRNRSTTAYEDVKVVDKVASIAKVVKEKQLGTLSPSRVATKGRNTFVEWKIPRLEGGEERVIYYKIESRLSILGDFKLKKAMVEYGADNVRSQSYSNEFFIDVQGHEIKVPSLEKDEPMPRRKVAKRPVKTRKTRR